MRRAHGGGGTVDPAVRYAEEIFRQPLLAVVHMSAPLLLVQRVGRERSVEAQDARRIRGAGAKIALLPTADEAALEADGSFDVERIAALAAKRAAKT